MSRTLRTGALAGALVVGVVVGGSANVALARSPIMAQSQPSQSSASSDQVTAAIQEVIQKANADQIQAVATGDASAMAETATTDRLGELQQVNQDLADNGVTDIQLMRLEWGPITVNGNSASATTYETWAVHTDDGATQVSRDTNVYSLVQDNSGWKIQSDEHPGNASTSGSGASRFHRAPHLVRSRLPAAARVSPVFPSRSSPFRVMAPASRRPPLARCLAQRGRSTPQTPSRPSTTPRPSITPSQDTSHNWSGYAATEGKYTSVSGTWTIPQVSSNGAPGVGATLGRHRRRQQPRPDPGWHAGDRRRRRAAFSTRRGSRRCRRFRSRCPSWCGLATRSR